MDPAHAATSEPADRCLPDRGSLVASLAILLCVLAANPSPAPAATISACGTIGSPVTWTANNVYVVGDCATIVAAGATLSIQPGTVVKLGSTASVVLVQGALQATGTSGSPIVFTSLRDDSRGGDTNGDGPSAGARGDWGGIRFAAGSQGTLAHVEVAYGGSGAFDHVGAYNLALVESSSSAVSLDHVTLRNSTKHGLYADGASVQIAFGQVRDNGEYGIYYNGVDGAVPLSVADTTFADNGAQAGWISFRDRAGTLAFERCSSTGPRNAIRVSGYLTEGSVRWSNGGDLPLLVEGGARIGSESALQLDPGTVMKFAGGRDTLLIEGELQALGTDAAAIVFTSGTDDAHGGDTNGDGASSTPRKGEWAALRFAAGSEGNLLNVVAAYGGSGSFDYFGRYNTAIIEGYSSDVALHHVALQSSGLDGLYAENASVEVADSQIADNAHYGLSYRGPDPSVALEVRDTSFSGNGFQAGWLHFVDAPASVTFENNHGVGPRNGIRVDGRLNGGFLRWDNGDELPLVVEGGLAIAAATTLQLQPGTVMKFAGVWDALLVEGAVEALGTADAQIVFTGIGDDAHGGDTNGDGPSTGEGGQWAGLRFLAGSQGALSHFFVGYGGSGAFDYFGHYNRALIESDSSAVALDHCTIRTSFLDGLYAANASVAVSFCTVEDNRLSGLHYAGVDPLVPLRITDNVFGGTSGVASRLELLGNPPEITLARNTGTGSGFIGGFSVSGTINANTVWDNTGSLPLVIDGGLTVAEGVTLTVLPGTVVKFAAVQDVIQIAGELRAVGAEDAEIAFTGIADDARGGDTNGDGAGAAAPGQWGGLRFLAGSSGQLAHVFIGYGGSGAFDYRGRYNTALLESSSSDVVLENVTLHASNLDGVRASGASMSVADSTFTNNAIYGLRYDGIDPETPLGVIGNIFAGNGAQGAWLHLTSGGTITAADNEAAGPKSGFRVDGTLASGSFAWDCPEQPLVVEGGLAIDAGAALDIGPGSLVKFAGIRDVLQVSGSLDAIGTDAAPIVLTSLADDAHGGDTNGDGPSSGAPGQWGSLRALGGRVELRHASIANGGSGAFDYFGRYGTGLVELRGGETRITHGTIAGSAQPGVYAERAQAIFSYNAIVDNAGNAIQNAVGGTVDARRNWWGDETGPYHPALNPGGKGGTVGNGVRFDPWLDRYAWLEPATLLLHGIEALSWRAFDTDPGSIGVDVSASNGLDSVVFGQALPASGALDWNTRDTADGQYELRAAFRDGDGHIVGEPVLSVIVNNDASIEWHGGRIAGTETWVASRLHVVESDVIVGAGAHLVIEPGAVVKFLPGTRLIIEAGGTADALATMEAPIVLTSVGDDSVGGDTNLDGALSQPRPGDWSGAQIDTGGDLNRTDFVDIRFSQATHGGALTSDETWLGSLLHRVTADVVVPNGVTLTIEAGAIIKLGSHLGIVLQPGARLFAEGVEAQPVVFTSERDDAAGGDSNQDGDTTVPAPGDWRWLYVDGAEAVLDHVELRYGAGTASGNWDQTGMIRTNGAASVTVSNSLLRDALFDGVLAWGGSVAVQSSILTNIDRAISAHPGSPVDVIHCTVDDNRIGLLVHGGTLDVVNTVVSNSAESGIQYDFGTLGSVRYTDVWKPAGSSSVNYRNTSDRTGDDGNISVDPAYVARALRNYRLDYRSPLIDAADGAMAPPSDYYGAPRYDDPRSPNSGTPTGGGAFADIGAWEFVESAPSPIDLIVSNVTGPTAVVAGETARVSWTVTNAGTAEALGPWHDTINLVYSPEAGSEVVFAAEVLVGQGKRLGPGQSLAASAEIRVPGSIVAEHRWQVVTNSRGEIFEGANRANNATLSVASVMVDLPELVIGGAALERRFEAVGEPHWFKLEPSAGDDVLVRLDRDGVAGVTELYLARGYVPKRQRFDTRQQETASADVTVLAAGASAQTYYILAYPKSLPPGSESFYIGAAIVPFSIESVGPAEVGNAGAVTLAIRGGKLHEGLVFEIVDPLGGVHRATSVFVVDSSLVYATFDLGGLPVGSYRVRVSDGPQTVTAPSMTSVVAGSPGKVRASLVMPEVLRPDWTGMVTVDYANEGGTDVVAPLMFLAVTNASLRLPGQAELAGSTLQLLGISNQGPAGVLPPGARGTITLELVPSGDRNIEGKLWIVSEPDRPIDWNALEGPMRPEFVPDDAWEAIFANFRGALGDTVGEMHGLLADNATYLSRLGEYTADVRRLLGLELNRAGVGYLSERYALGAFGRGTPVWWEIRARTLADGRIEVVDGGRHRFFQPRGDGQYVGLAGDLGALLRTDGGYELREPDGPVTVFDSEGRLAYVEDTNGNRVTAGYADGRLTTVTSSDGDTVTYRYDRGRVVEATDSVGRTVEYAYDASGEHLAQITDSSGTTVLTYVTGRGAAREHALESMSFADGTSLHFEYDDRGRLSRHHAGDGAEPVELSYGAGGQVTLTDASGGSQSVFLDADGAPALLVNHGGQSIGIDWADRLPTLIRGPDGSVVRAEYDSSGMATQIVDPLGHRLTASYEDGQPTAVTNARGATTRHDFDEKGNRIRTTYPDGRSEQFAYDDKGNLVQWTNGRGRTVSYGLDASGVLGREDLPDGSHRELGYDAHGNIAAVTDARGTTAFTYDAADQLTRVTYPDGRLLRFSYDAGGRRTRLEDQDGFVLSYAYDELGRLVRVSDADDEELTAYIYDLAGRLSRKVLGNGVRADYTYDSNGRLAAIVNTRPDSSLISRFEYEYDAAGRRVRTQTAEGEWRYTYDGAGRLSGASFTSSDMGLADRDLSYTYDPAGNRMQTVEDGTTTTYVANLADQYTRAGDEVLRYDDDGNLIERKTGGGAWLYEYDDEGQLVRVEGPGGVWTYEYDALGHRSAAVENGVRREYVVDPISGQLAGVYDEDGNIIARYAHGFDLSARIGAGGEISYYTLDALASVTEVLDAGGAVMNSYRYGPFGEEHRFLSTLDDPLRYLGGLGATDEGNGLLFMRARYYDPQLGRFTQRDPVGGAQGPNLYQYAAGDPVNRLDPFGTFWGSELFWAGEKFMGAFGPLTDGELWVTISNGFGFDKIRQFEHWREFHQWWRQGGSLRFAAKEFGKYTLNQARAGLRFASNIVRSGAGQLARLGRALSSIRIQITNVPPWIAKIPAAISSVTTTLGTSVTSLGAGTIAAGVVVAGAVGVAIGTGLRYIPGVDEAAQSAWTKLDEWTGGWLFGTPPVAEAGTRMVSSHDPNDLLGPAGYGAARWVSSDVVLAYTIRFENDKSASAPAQVVRVVQQLDPDLDFATFELGSFGFGDLVVQVPPGRRFHSERIDLTATRGVFVDVTAEIDIETGIVTWELRSIDPDTGLAPRDPFAGFLPPNETSPMGQGFVSYTVRARPSVAGGQWVDAMARIFFDTNEPIDTPPHLNTLDADSPSSQVQPLPEITYSPSVRVRWSGSDDGSGVAAYDVYVSVDGGLFSRWLSGVSQTSATYAGRYGCTYGFYSIARDQTGRVEAPPPAADATTRTEPLPGDANCDGVLSAADLPAMVRDLQSGVPGACPSDTDLDGDVDDQDVRLLLDLLFQP